VPGRLLSVLCRAYALGVSFRLKLALIGSVLVGLGVGAHTIAAGSISQTGLLLSVLLGFGLAVPISRGALKRFPLALSIFGAEMLIHLSLCVGSHAADHSAASAFMPSAVMLLWHGVAATIAMFTITFLDSIYTAWTRMISAAIGGFYLTSTVESEVNVRVTGSDSEFFQEFLVTTEISRGPPAYALCA